MRRLVYLLSVFGSALAHAQDAPPARPLTGTTDPVALPGVGSVVIAFLITLAVGVGIIYVLKRFAPLLPRLLAGRTTDSAPMIVATKVVHQTLKLHIVETHGTKVLIAEGRNGLAMTVLSSAQSSAQLPTQSPTQSPASSTNASTQS